MGATTIFLIRHGLCDPVGKWLSGRSPGVSLNAEGRAQALDLVQRMEGIPLHAIYSSPLERTRQTAEPLARSRGLDVRVEESIQEFDIGDWTGKSFAELHENPRWRYFNSFRSQTRAPSGESMLDVQARAIGWLERVRERHASESVALVSHGDVIKAIVMYQLGVPIDFLHRIEVSPASVSEFRLDEGGAGTLLALNIHGTPMVHR